MGVWPDCEEVVPELPVALEGPPSPACDPKPNERSGKKGSWMNGWEMEPEPWPEEGGTMVGKEKDPPDVG